MNSWIWDPEEDTDKPYRVDGRPPALRNSTPPPSPPPLDSRMQYVDQRPLAVRLAHGPWPFECQLTSEMEGSPVLVPHAQSRLLLYDQKYVIKLHRVQTALDWENMFLSAAGDCAVPILARLFRETKFVGFLMRLEQPLDLSVDLQTRLWMMDEVKEVVTKLHQRNVVHGDLTLSNLLRCTDGRIRLCDFENATFAHSWPASAPHVITPICCSQSKLKHLASPWSPADDIYSLGALLYHIATGQRAYPGKSDGDLVRAILEGEMPAMDAVPSDRARAVIAACLYAIRPCPGLYTDTRYSLACGRIYLGW